MAGDCAETGESRNTRHEGQPTIGGDPVPVCLAATAEACTHGRGGPGDAGWEARARLIRRMDEVEMQETEEPATIFTLPRQRP
jgi:hypothetical protein